LGIGLLGFFFFKVGVVQSFEMSRNVIIVLVALFVLVEIFRGRSCPQIPSGASYFSLLDTKVLPVDAACKLSTAILGAQAPNICAVGDAVSLSRKLRKCFPDSIITVFDQAPMEGKSAHEVVLYSSDAKILSYHGSIGFSMPSYFSDFPTRKCALFVLEGSPANELDVPNLRTMSHKKNIVFSTHAAWSAALSSQRYFVESKQHPSTMDVIIGSLQHEAMPKFTSTGPTAELTEIIEKASWQDVNLTQYKALSDALEASARAIGWLEGHSGQLIKERKMYTKVAQMSHVKTICEIGFNAGHSASLWLRANPTADVIMFDLFYHNYSRVNEIFLKTRGAEFGLKDVERRLRVVVGSSLVAVPQFARDHPDVKCDILSVDGSHRHEDALQDIANMRALANRKFHVLFVDDTNCRFFYCVDRAVREFESKGEIVALWRMSEEPVPEKNTFARGVTLLQYTSLPN